MTARRFMTLGRRLAGSQPIAVAALVVANLVPLVGVLFFSWDVMTILVLYWIENGIVGLFNVARMATAGRGEGKAVYVPFFCLHYGIFWVVHGVFVFNLPLLVNGAASPPTAIYLAIGALSLLASHGTSFVANYVGRGEYRTATIDGLMLAPYGRVVVLHLTVLLGGFAALDAGGPVLLVALLVVLKTGLDLLFHLIEHRARPYVEARAPAKAPVEMRPGGG